MPIIKIETVLKAGMTSHNPIHIPCFTSRTTVTSARILEEDACYRVRNLCVISHIQKGTPGLTYNKGCVLQRVSLGVLSDVTVILGMRQSIAESLCVHLLF